jgi:hypothetical protein
MKRFKHAVAIVAGSVILGLVAEAGAAEFSPRIEFSLGDKKANANTTVRVVLKQETGEEELNTVELRIPPGYNLATDQQLKHNELLAAGSIEIDAGPRCRPGGPPVGSAPVNVPVEVVEHDRTSAQIASGVEAVYFVDLEPVTRVVLEVTGNPNKGWKLAGFVPANENTCPPFTFDVTFRARAAESDTPIFTNPQFGGSYSFEAKFVGLQNSVSESKQTVTIEGPGPGGGEGTQTTGTKSCKGLKKKARKRCKKKLRG